MPSASNVTSRSQKTNLITKPSSQVAPRATCGTDQLYLEQNQAKKTICQYCQENRSNSMLFRDL